MAISECATRRLKERVREISDELTASGLIYNKQPEFLVWDIVRDALGKSYADCEDVDIPRALDALEFFLERLKSETR